MAFIARMVNIFKADIHGVMDQLEDRRLLLKQHLRDMVEALHRKEANLGKLMASHQQGLKDLAEYTQQWETLDQNLTLAVGKNKDETARILIRKMKPLKDLRDELARHLKTLDQEIIQFKNHLQQQRLRYQQLKHRSAQYLLNTRVQQSEKTVIDPVFDGSHAEPTDQEIELELLKRKDALGAAP